MFFVREQCIKVVAVILLLNACSTYGEPPNLSSYLPPNQDDKSNQFSSFGPSSNFNSNSQPIETTISLTTNDPISFSSFSFSDKSPTAPSTTYGLPNENLNTRLPGSSNKGNGANNNALFNQPPRRGQQASDGNKGYFYQQPNPSFKEPSEQFGGAPVRNPTSGSSNLPSFGSSPTASSNPTSTGYSDGPSPTYGVPFNKNTGNDFGTKENLASVSNQPNRIFGQSASNSLSTSYGPPLNNSTSFSSPSTLYGAPSNAQGASGSFPDRRKEPSRLSTSYGPPTLSNFRPTGNNIDSTALGAGSTLSNRNPFSSFVPQNSAGRRPLNALRVEGTPQTLYGPPSLNQFDRNPSEGDGSGGTFSSPSPSYGPPINSFSSGSTSQSPSQNSGRPFDSSGAGYQNLPNQRPSQNLLNQRPSSSYGSPSPAVSGTGYSSGTQNQISLPSSYGPPSAAESGSGYSQSAQSQTRPSSSYGAPSPASGTAEFGTGYSQSVQSQTRPSSSYGTPSAISGISEFGTGYSQSSQGQKRPSSSYGPPSPASDAEFSPNAQNQARPSTSYGAPSLSPDSGYNQNVPTSPRPSLSYGAPSLAPETGYNQNAQNQARPSSSYGTPSISQTGYTQNAQNQARPSSSYGLPSSGSETGYNQNSQNQGGPSYQPPLATTPNRGYSQNAQNQPRPSITYDSPSSASSGTGYPQKVQNQARPSLNLPNSYTDVNPPSSQYGPPNTLNNVPSSSYQRPSNVFQSQKPFGSENTLSSLYGLPSSGPSNNAPGSTYSGDSNTFSTSYESSRPSSGKAPSGTFSIENSVSPSYSGSTLNSYDQDFTSNSKGYPSASTSSGFGGNAPSPTYGAPIPSFTVGTGSLSYTTPSSIGQFSNPPSSSYGAPADRDNQQTAFTNTLGNQSPTSESRPFAVTGNEKPSKLYGPPEKLNDFTGGENALSSFGQSYTPTSSGFSGTQSEPEIFNTNAASSYLPPSYSEGTGFPTGSSFSDASSDDIIPSTSYTLPSDEPNPSRGRPSNTVKNPSRNVGSDLITGASTSPFKPFNEDSPGYPSSNTPSRASYEKSQEITSNALTSSGSDSSAPAKYEFNYNVKDAGTEFNHQESRNGTTTSGSYGVVLPDGRKQVVDYEANQEGFHPKIRYEENAGNSIQQSQANKGFDSAQNNGYSYPGNQQFSPQYSQNINQEPFGDKGSSPNYNQELQPPYPSSLNYDGSTGNQDIYSSSQGSTLPQSSLANNFNTYKNPGTSPSGQDSYSPTTNQDTNSSYNPDQGSQTNPDSQGYNYSPGAINDSPSQGYPSGPNIKPGGKQIPFFT